MSDVMEPRLGAVRGSALLACVLALLGALGGLQASSASALGKQCSGTNVRGLGSFLQTQAQQRWSSQGELGFNGSANLHACSGSQGSGGTPAVNYVPLSSPDALRAWGAEDGIYHAKEWKSPVLFLGTDIAPSGHVLEEGTMLANMKAALGSDLAVVPVTQTSIAIAANPPRMPAHPACVVPKLTAAQVEKIFNGEIRNWRQLSFASDRTLGGDCDQSITRIVRPESSGVTYQFKHYLNSVNPAPLDCTGKEKRTWAQLQAPYGGETPPNEEWPRNAECQEEEGPVTTVAPGSGEGEYANLAFVAESPGTITYGSLPEAQQWAPKQIVDVHNGATYADPETGEGSANCAAADYTLPAGWESGVNVDWSQVYGSDPSIGKTAKNAYPICTLTWDVAATEKFSGGGATTVRDYLAFVAAEEGGQTAVRYAGYTDLPWQVAKAARAAIAQIGSGEEEGEEEEGGTGTVLCQVEPEAVEGVLTCPKGEGFNEGKVTGKVPYPNLPTFFSTSGPELLVLCPEGRYLGEFNEDGSSAGGIYEFAFGQVEPCSASFPGEPETVVKFENLPFDASAFKYSGAESPNGSFALAKSGGSPWLRIESTTAVCLYLSTFLDAKIVNGSPTLMMMQGKWKLAEEAPEGLCPTTLESAVTLTVTRSGEELPLYIAGK